MGKPFRENGRQNSKVVNFIPEPCLPFVRTVLFTEKWRKEPESAITNFHFLTLTYSLAPVNFPPERHEKAVFHLLSDRIFLKHLVDGKQSVKLYTLFKTHDPESHTLFTGAVVPFVNRRCHF